MHCLLFLEFIGTTELLVVLLVALLVFGPRKLPELGRSLGRTLNQVRAASDDFKRTWEAEALSETETRAARALQSSGVQDAATGSPAELRQADEAQLVEARG